MLCYNGLGNQKLAKEHEVRYMRFKADEASQAITGPYRQKHPEDNNERQAVHEHGSVPLPVTNHVATAVVRHAQGRLTTVGRNEASRTAAAPVGTSR
jgi:hypothetical protein